MDAIVLENDWITGICAWNQAYAYISYIIKGSV